MKITFCPYDFEYKIREGKVLMHLYGKLDDNSKVVVVHEYYPFFYAALDNIDEEEFLTRLKHLSIESGSQTAVVTRTEKVEREFLGKKQYFLQVYVNYPKAVPILSKEVKTWGVECYENTILFVHRYLRDHNITPCTIVEVEGEFVESTLYRVPLFVASSVRDLGKEAIQKWKTLAIDIETYAETKEINAAKNPVLMVAFYGEDEEGKEFRKVITWKRFDHKLDYLEHVETELDLLDRFKEILIEYNPDIITGYFTDGFDFPYLKERAAKHKIKLDVGVDRSEIRVGKNFRQGEARIAGFLHLDMLKFIRNIFGGNLKTRSFSLNAVSEELLGHKKHDVNLDELAHVWDNAPERLPDFCEYNLHDSHLAFQLCDTLMPDMIEFTKLIALPTADVIRMRFSRLVENYIMKRAMEFGIVAPNKPGDYELEMRRREHVKGGFVFEPEPGLYEDVVVLDFRSLYPTIISAHNIGPEGFTCECCIDKKHVPGRENWWFCSEEKKFMPSVLERLILRRVDLKRLIKDFREKGEDTKILESRSYALKILANSFYGYLGFFGARWYSIESAGATTAYARNYIKTTIAKAEKRGFKVIYADTDSCFLLLGDHPLDTALAFMNEINFDLPGHMELEFEGHYSRGIFVSAKGSDKGAKKKYALWDGKLKVTGFAAVRRNWSPIAKEVQEHVLELVLSDRVDEAIDYAREMVDKVEKGTMPLEKFTIRTQITKELKEYSAIGPHVAVARRLQESGEAVRPGTLVEYVIGKGTGLIRDKAKLLSEIKEGEYDPVYYMEHQIKPALAEIFKVLGYEEDEIFAKTAQKGLGAFF